MKTSNSKAKAFAFWGAAFVLLIAVFTGCKQSAGGSNEGGSSSGGTVHEAPFVEGGASLILSPDKLDIKVEVTTSDGTPVRIEGCTETTLTSGTETVLHAKGTLVILKGKIIDLQVCNRNSYNPNKLIALNVQGLNALEQLYCYENQFTELNVQGLTALGYLYCSNNQLTSLNTQGCTALYILYCNENQLTALNVQDCTALQTLWCYVNQLTELNVQGCIALENLDCSYNQLTASVFKKLFDDLPVRQNSDNAMCVLYTEKTGVTEGNHKDFTAPSDLAAAFNNAKTVKKWKMYKRNGSGNSVEI